MSDAVVYEQLDQDAHRAPEGTGAPPAGVAAAGDLRRLSDVPVELTVEIGRTRMTVGETLQLRPGSIVTLERLAGEPVDLLVNGTPIARGEVVVVDEQFGLRVTEVVEGDPDGAQTEGPVVRAGDSPLGEELNGEMAASVGGEPIDGDPTPTDLSAAE